MENVLGIIEMILVVPLAILLGILSIIFNSVLYVIYFINWRILRIWPDRTPPDEALMGDTIGIVWKVRDKTVFDLIKEKDLEFGAYWEEVHYRIFHRFIDD